MKKSKQFLVFGTTFYVGIQALYPILFTIAHQKFLKVLALPEGEVISGNHPYFEEYYKYSNATTLLGSIIQNPLFWVGVLLFLVYGFFKFGDLWIVSTGVSMIGFSWIVVFLIALFSKYVLNIMQVGNYYELLRPSTSQFIIIWIITMFVGYTRRYLQRNKKSKGEGRE